MTNAAPVIVPSPVFASDVAVGVGDDVSGTMGVSDGGAVGGRPGNVYVCEGNGDGVPRTTGFEELFFRITAPIAPANSTAMSPAKIRCTKD